MWRVEAIWVSCVASWDHLGGTELELSRLKPHPYRLPVGAEGDPQGVGLSTKSFGHRLAVSDGQNTSGQRLALHACACTLALGEKPNPDPDKTECTDGGGATAKGHERE